MDWLQFYLPNYSVGQWCALWKRNSFFLRTAPVEVQTPIQSKLKLKLTHVSKLSKRYIILVWSFAILDKYISFNRTMSIHYIKVNRMKEMILILN